MFMFITMNNSVVFISVHGEQHDEVPGVPWRRRLHGLVPERSRDQLDPLARKPDPLLAADPLL